MHLVFISSLLTLGHTGLYPSSPVFWPSSTDFIVKSNETYNPKGCSRDQVLQVTHGVLSWFRRGIIESIARKEPKNFAISPLAVSLAMFMLTSAPVEKEIPTNRSNLNNVECFQLMGMQPLFDYLAEYESTGLSLASCVFVSPKLELRPVFIDTVTKTFRTPLRRVDFEDPTERADFISRWGPDHITSLVDADTSLALINVIYFKAEWALQFNVDDTKTHTSQDHLGNTVLTSFMYMKAHIRNGRHPKANASFYELPFKSDDDARNISMFVITPDRIPNVESATWDVLENMEEFNIADLISYGSYSSIPIFLRKFKVESIIDIEPAVKKTLAENNIFDRQTTKLSGISESVHLFGNKLVQRIIMEVDESGCLAITSETLADPTPRNYTYWDALPYYVLIGTTDENPQVLFAGRYYS